MTIFERQIVLQSQATQARLRCVVVYRQGTRGECSVYDSSGSMFSRFSLVKNPDNTSV